MDTIQLITGPNTNSQHLRCHCTLNVTHANEATLHDDLNLLKGTSFFLQKPQSLNHIQSVVIDLVTGQGWPTVVGRPQGDSLEDPFPTTASSPLITDLKFFYSFIGILLPLKM